MNKVEISNRIKILDKQKTKLNIYSDNKYSTLVSSKFYGIISLIIILSFIAYKYTNINIKTKNDDNNINNINNINCEDYVFTTYIYMILSLIIIFSVVIANEHTGFYTPILNLFNEMNILIPISIIIINIFIISIFKIRLSLYCKTNIDIYVTWILLLIFTGFFLIPIFHFTGVTSVTNVILLISILLSISIIFIRLVYGDQHIKFRSKLKKSIIIYLLLLIIFPLFSYTSLDKNGIYFTNIILKCGALILCVIFLLTNNNSILAEYNKCKHENIQINYPEESFNIFMLIKYVISDVFGQVGICSYNYKNLI